MTSRYENGTIYKLVCTDGHYYIGSTTQKRKEKMKQEENIIEK